METKFSQEIFKHLRDMKPTQVTVQLPKMRIASEGNIKDYLSTFGLDSIFQPKTADFSRISDTRKPNLLHFNFLLKILGKSYGFAWKWAHFQIFESIIRRKFCTV